MSQEEYTRGNGMAKILVVDGGGRGNAIAHSFKRSNNVEEVYVSPGNAGVYEYGGKELPLEEVGYENRISELIDKVEDWGIDLVVPGPEGWISAGIVDEFRERTDVPIVGPTQDAAFLETSKCDAKDYLSSIGVPVPKFENFDDPEEAKEYAKQFYDENPDGDLVPKADGIAAGKGAFVCGSLEETLNAIDEISSKEFNEEYEGAGSRIEIEERLYGEEISFFAITDGRDVEFFGTAKDYKRRFSDPDDSFIDEYFFGINPNTGGMGAYSPQEVGLELKDRIMEEIAIPTVENLEEEYKGILHFVLMTREGTRDPHVLEINVRDGDPEAQTRLPRLESDIYELYQAVVNEKLREVEIEWSDECCVGVCAVSGRPWKDGKPAQGYAGYPGDYFSKQPIFLRGSERKRIGKEGIGEYVDGVVYHNGTDLHQGYLRSRGGRVLTFTNTGSSLEKARERTYSDLEGNEDGGVFFSFMDYRKDIGQ
ncbi:MAG: phosphoribosylamine--glycine ligase [Candidatus Hadarchaeota archaeon]